MRTVRYRVVGLPGRRRHGKHPSPTYYWTFCWVRTDGLRAGSPKGPAMVSQDGDVTCARCLRYMAALVEPVELVREG